jgi:serpin B
VEIPVTSILHSRFSLSLLNAISPTGAGNVACSPWSVGSALAILAPGVDSLGRAELVEVLAAGAPADDAVGQLGRDATAAAGPAAAGDQSILTVANRLWVEEASTPQPAFVAHLEGWPGAELRRTSLVTDPEAARRQMNADVAETTRGLIPEVLPRGSVTGDDRAVLLNAVYLLAGWIRQFSVDRTEAEPFHGRDGDRDVPMMRATRDASYASRDGWAYLTLPLWLGMRAEVLLPPNPPNPPNPATIPDLDPRVLEELRDSATPHRVDLHLPRFRVTTAVDLIPPLERLGVRRIFDPSAPALVGVVVGEALFISGAFHQTVLRVDEKGVEGAAATGMVAQVVALPVLPEVEVRVDRPFFFLVSHQQTGSVLFLARVASP